MTDPDYEKVRLINCAIYDTTMYAEYGTTQSSLDVLVDSIKELLLALGLNDKYEIRSKDDIPIVVPKCKET